MEESINSVMSWLQSVAPWVKYLFMGLGVLVLGGQTYVLITPNKEDDAWLAKIEAMPVVGHLLRAFRAFAPWQKKDK